MFILMGFRKNGDTRCIATNQDRKILEKLCDKLDIEAGIQNYSESIWSSDKIKGYFWIDEITGDPLQNGTDFINYCGKYKNR